MIWNLLTSASSSSGTGTEGGCNSGSLLLPLVLIVAMVALYFVSKRSQQKREAEMNKTLDAIQPGSKVKTIGGICGVVVELCPEDNTFILETGSEESGKSYIKFDKKAVYQTDAVPAAPVVEETPVEAEAPVAEEAPFEEIAEAPVEEIADAPVEEATEEESKEE